MKNATWTITADLLVFAGDMTKEEVEQIAQERLLELLDGTDFCGLAITNATRNED